MTLAELLQMLSYGPLSELAIGGNGSGTVPAGNIPKLVLRINAALTQLYTRFPLQLRTIAVATVDGLYHYPLRQEFAQTSASSEINKFIQDTVAEPFLGDVLAIASVADSANVELPLNDRNDALSWHVTSYDTLSMGYPLTGTTFFVQYQAAHAPIPLVPNDPALVQIRLPRQLENALLACVAAKIYGGMSMEGALGKAQMHEAEYEKECSYHELNNTFGQSAESGNVKPALFGWNA